MPLIDDLLRGVKSHEDSVKKCRKKRHVESKGTTQRRKPNQVLSAKSSKETVKSSHIEDTLTPEFDNHHQILKNSNSEHRKEQIYRAVKKHRASKRDIGPLPECTMPKERAAGENNLELFLKTAFPCDWDKPFSASHLEMLDNMALAIEHGGLFLEAFPRGSGKTTIAVGVIIWAVLYAKRLYIAIIAANMGEAKKLTTMIINELSDNEILLAMFPEVCYPFSVITHSNQAPGQVLNGLQTRISKKDSLIVLPNVEGSKASGIMIKPFGLTGAIRGALAKNPVLNKKIRPDFFMIDDPQTDESAYSTTQCEFREMLIQHSVLGLAGPGTEIGGVISGTVIRKGDLMDVYLNRKYPEYHIMRVPFFLKWPERMDLWEEYLLLRKSDHEPQWTQSTEFYLKNRDEMDRGSEVYWPERLESGAVSGIQSGFNLIHRRGMRAFMSECQNDPEDISHNTRLPTFDDVQKRVNHLKHLSIPSEAQYLTAGIDVQKNILYYVVAAWKDQGTGWVVDYGTFPKQPRPVFTAAGATVLLEQIYHGESETAVVIQGLAALVRVLSSQPYLRVNGDDMMQLGKVFADSGYLPAAVYTVKREFLTLLDPSRGVGIGASKKPMEEYQKKPGEVYGHHWYYPAVAKSRDFPRCDIDVNYWKGFCSDALLKAPGDSGAITIFGNARSDHRLLAEHLTSESFVETEGNGRKVREWKIKPGQTENHFFDCLVNAAAAASRIGMRMDDDLRKLRSGKKKRYVRFSEIIRNNGGNE